MAQLCHCVTWCLQTCAEGGRLVAVVAAAHCPNEQQCRPGAVFWGCYFGSGIGKQPHSEPWGLCAPAPQAEFKWKAGAVMGELGAEGQSHARTRGLRSQTGVRLMALMAGRTAPCHGLQEPATNCTQCDCASFSPRLRSSLHPRKLKHKIGCGTYKRAGRMRSLQKRQRPQPRSTARIV